MSAVIFPEVVLPELLLVPRKGFGYGVCLKLLLRLLMHPQLTKTLFFNLDPVLQALGVEDKGRLATIAVTHRSNFKLSKE